MTTDDRAVILDALMAEYGALGPVHMGVAQQIAALLAVPSAVDAAAAVKSAELLVRLHDLLPGKIEADAKPAAWDLTVLDDGELDALETLATKCTIGAGAVVDAPAEPVQSHERRLRDHIVLIENSLAVSENEVFNLRLRIAELEGRPANERKAPPDESALDAAYRAEGGLRRLLAAARPDLRGQDLERAIRDAADGKVVLPAVLTDARNDGLIAAAVEATANVVTLRGRNPLYVEGDL